MLRTLHANKVLDDRLHDWANLLRTLGNEGAHTLESVDQQAAQDALQFCEAMLDYTYVLRARFEAFQDRRAAESTKAAAS